MKNRLIAIDIFTEIENIYRYILHDKWKAIAYKNIINKISQNKMENISDKMTLYIKEINKTHNLKKLDY